jgi:hypothetical protein
MTKNGLGYHGERELPLILLSLQPRYRSELPLKTGASFARKQRFGNSEGPKRGFGATH